ncbi:MAG: Ldh family oxidoreductase [Desulfocucumaceae bacterium]
MSEDAIPAGGKHVHSHLMGSFCRGVLERAGMPPGDATILADCLVEADLRGHGTHGAARLGMYLERVK